MYYSKEMSNIWFTSDTHFCHNKEFLYKPRGFDNVWDMNDAIVENWGKTVGLYDEVYLLGDVMLNDDDVGLSCLRALTGKIHIIIGNHDTDNRIEKYKQCWNVVEVAPAARLKYKKLSFFLTHYPCYTSNPNDPNSMVFNLYGHTHQKTNFFHDNSFMYHVGLDSHNCTPVSFDEILEDLREAQYERSKTN